ncbi:MAG: UDP-N-acetylglucosamine 2-epimerase [Pseudomonadota bacterium]
MKHICIVAGTLNDYLILTPLIKEIQKDRSMILTVISTDHHQSPEMEIAYRRLEEEGFLSDEQTDIIFKSKQMPMRLCPADFKQLEYKHLFRRLAPDIIVLCGNSYETLSAAINASLYDIPMAHIQGGESGFRTWDDAYGYGITKLAHLHFTSTEEYRDQVLGFGEHPQRIFNVGSLLTEQIKNLPFTKDSVFYNETGLGPADDFLFINFQPDSDLGSKNSCIFETLLNTLTDPLLSKYQLLFNTPEERGLGKIISRMIEQFCHHYPNRTVVRSAMNLTDISHAIKYCSAVIGNSPEAFVMAPTFKKPVINLGTRQQDCTRTINIIDCGPDTHEIMIAIQNGLSATFNFKIQQMQSPFDQPSTARKIREILNAFNRSDISTKAYFRC